MELSKKRLIGAIGVLVYLIGISAVLADTEETTVTFVIPTSIDHSVAYGASCSSSLFYFVETDATKDGTQGGLNVTSDAAGANKCQNTTLSAMTISNVGSVNANITANFTAALPSGITVKVGQNYTAYESSCTGPPVNESQCGNVSIGAPIVVIEDLTAQTGTDDLWWWCDMSDFNSGVATSGIARTLQTHAIDNS